MPVRLNGWPSDSPRKGDGGGGGEGSCDRPCDHCPRYAPRDGLDKVGGYGCGLSVLIVSLTAAVAVSWRLLLWAGLVS